jgi:hypothetical protein
MKNRLTFIPGTLLKTTSIISILLPQQTYLAYVRQDNHFKLDLVNLPPILSYPIWDKFHLNTLPQGLGSTPQNSISLLFMITKIMLV